MRGHVAIDVPKYLLVCSLLVAVAACEHDDVRRSATDSTKERDSAEARVRTGTPVRPRVVAVTQFDRPDPRPLAVPVRSAILRPLDSSQAKVSTNGFDSARVCGACHPEIFEKWSLSMHAMSYTDPIFEEALLRAYYYSGGEAAERCLGCHSPTATRTGDLLGKTDLTKEGVTCDFCHSVGAITADSKGNLSYTIEHSVLHGPGRHLPDDEHGLARKEFFARSEICAGCHDYTMPDGTIVFATYSEWKASKYAEQGTQCQDCHMPRLQSFSMREKDGRMRQFNDHYLQGGHSPSQIKKAVKMSIEQSVRDSDRVHIVVALENAGAGHSVPTGLPSRTVVLSVDARQRGRVVFRREVVYQRVMQGTAQHALDDDWQIKLLSKGVLRDNRIRSGEVRRESFVFDAAPDQDIELRVRLAYRYKPQIVDGQTIEVPMGQLDRILARGI